MIAYCGYAKDENIVKHSSSGGLATVMSQNIIKAGGVVYGASYTADFKGAEYIRADSLSELDKLRGSKYIKAKFGGGGVLDLLANDISSGKKVLFIGLPCDIGLIKKYLKKRNIESCDFITVDLICYGPTYPSVAEQYIDTLEKKFHSHINDFSVRYKKPYWTPPYLYAHFDNGKVYCMPFYSTDYGVAFSKMSLSKCYNCDFKGDNHTSDITIGDYWGVENSDIGYNKYGTSIAFVHSECGKNFIESLKEDFHLYSADAKKALDNNPAYSGSINRNAKSDVFKEYFNKYGLKRAVKKTSSVKTKIGRIIPLRVKKMLKKIHK